MNRELGEILLLLRLSVEGFGSWIKGLRGVGGDGGRGEGCG